MDHFVLQAIDPSFGCPTLEALVPSPDVEVLKKLLGPDCADDPELVDSYTLGRDEARAVATQFSVAFDPIGPQTMLYRLNSNAQIPYPIHTGFELFLMLGGTKPFALFTISYPILEGEDAIGVMFEPHVQTGLIVKRPVDCRLQLLVNIRLSSRLVSAAGALGWSLVATTPKRSMDKNSTSLARPRS